MKVYLATSGDHGDYSILRVFRNREDAEAYELADDIDEREVEEGPVDVRRWHGLYWYSWCPDLAFNERGQTNPVTVSEPREYDPVQQVGHWWTVYEARSGSPGGHQLTVCGWDWQAVQKVYAEQRAQYMAKRDMGVTP